MTFAGKVAILPCTGVGQVMGTITRQVAYRVCEDERPDDTVLLCLPALAKGVQEDIDMVRQCPVLVIEGCKERCAAQTLATKDGVPAATVFLPDVIGSKKVNIRREARRNLTKPELTVVELATKAVVAEIDRLLPETKK